MRKIIKRVLITACWLLISVSMIHLSPVLSVRQAQADNNLLGTVKDGGLQAIGSEAYNTSGDPTDIRVMVAKVIYVLLGFLGIVFVVIVIWAGFVWMTAGGEEAKIEESKKRITAAVIGLVIVLAAWGATWYVMNVLITATTGTGLTSLQ